MGEYISIFQIGPVQDYINNAKRTQDFWSGSYILSYLSAVAVETANLELPECIVYPDCNDPLISVVKGKPDKPREHDFSNLGDRIGTLPNRFVAVHTDREKLEHALKLANGNISTAYEEIVRRIKEQLKSDLTAAKCSIEDGEWEKIWNRQNTHFFSTMWVIHEAKDALRQNYGKEYQLAERLFGARKGIRNFAQTEGEPGNKCNLCGEREQLDDLCGEREQLDDRIWDIIPKLHKFKYSFRKNERLCTSCMVKRLAPEIFFEKKSGSEDSISFPSTSTVAVSPAMCRLLEKWNDGEVQKDMSAFNDKLNDLKLDFPKKLKPLPYIRKLMNKHIAYPANASILQWDGDLFIKDTYQKKILMDDYKMDKNTSLKKIEDCREALKQLMTPFRPSKYYAVVMMDGDNMGKYLSDCQTMEDHKDFSRRLGSFAQKVVPRIAESYFSAKVAYFGGDEGVIFVSLDDLFPLMRCLRAAFSGHIRLEQKVQFTDDGSDEIQDVEKGEVYETAGKGKTACISAVVAHHQQSLLHVMEILRNSLKHKAKEVKGKDAFCITLMKRSGGTTCAVGKWKYDKLDVMAHLQKMAGLYKDKWLTEKWLYDLDREKTGLGTGERVYAEIIRLLRRHSTLDKENFQKNMEPVQQEMKIIYGNMFNDISEKTLENFIQLEFCAHYIAKGGGN